MAQAYIPEWKLEMSMSGAGRSSLAYRDHGGSGAKLFVEGVEKQGVWAYRREIEDARGTVWEDEVAWMENEGRPEDERKSVSELRAETARLREKCFAAGIDPAT